MVTGESCCGELVVSDGVVSRKYKILYFPGNKTNSDWGGKWVVSDAVEPQGRGPHDLFGGVGCTTEIVWGKGQGWLIGIAVKDV